MRLSVSMNRWETALGWCFFAAQLFFLPLLIMIVLALLGVDMTDTELSFLLFAVNFGLTVGIFHRFLWRCARVSLAVPFRCLRIALLGLVLYYAGSLLVSYFIGAVAPDFANVNDENIASMAGQQYTLMTLGTVLLVPITEETLYRGLVFCPLQKKSRLAAYLVSTAVFSAVHVVGYIGTAAPLTLLLCFVQYIPAGLALAWAYERADSIWAPILMHMTVNQIAMASLR